MRINILFGIDCFVCTYLSFIFHFAFLLRMKKRWNDHYNNNHGFYHLRKRCKEQESERKIYKVEYGTRFHDIVTRRIDLSTMMAYYPNHSVSLTRVCGESQEQQKKRVTAEYNTRNFETILQMVYSGYFKKFETSN